MSNQRWLGDRQDFNKKMQKAEHKDYLTGYSLSREKAMAPYSSALAWKIPWTEEPGGPQSMRSLRVGQD